MPGSVALAAPVTVLPYSLYRAFEHSREYLGSLDNTYVDGSSQRCLQVTSSIKRWHLTKRLTALQLTTLRDFYDQRKGSVEAFYFYDIYETYDPTGVSTTGRFTVHFLGEWSQDTELGQRGNNCTIQLEELA